MFFAAVEKIIRQLQLKLLHRADGEQALNLQLTLPRREVQIDIVSNLDKF